MGTTLGAGTAPTGLTPAGKADYVSSAPELGTFQLGGVVFPLATGTGNSQLQDADPALYYATLFFGSVLQTYLGPKWSEAINAAGITSMPAGSIVRTTIPFDPREYITLTQQQITFPALCLYRRSARISERTVNWYHEEATWGCDFIVSPLSPGQLPFILPIVHRIPAVLANRIDLGFDPSYSSGQTIWQSAGIEEIGLTAYSLGHWNAGEGLPFIGMSMTLSVLERQKTPAGAFDQITGVDLSMDVQNSDGTIIPSRVDAQVNR